MPDFDLVVREGTLVTAGTRAVADLGIAAGRIVQIGGDMAGYRELEANGSLVTPGGVDPHVHLTNPSRADTGIVWVDDFESGTRAALAGGVTTVGNMSFCERDETLPDGIARDAREADATALCDVFLHPVLLRPTEANLASIAGLHTAGHTSLKLFMSLGNFDRHVLDFVAAMRTVARSGGVALVHCEDHAIMACCCEALREAGTLGPAYFPDARPVVSEVVSTQRAVGFAEATGCPVYVVHLASARALAVCQEARGRGLPVYVETRPLYLHLTRERFCDADGAKYAGAPPLREAEDVQAMWSGLAFGHIDTLATDHAPWRLAEKLDPAFDATNLRQGVADLETSLPMAFSTGVVGGRISAEQFVAVTATNPAKLFGLYPRKGTLAVGSDADLVIWNETRTRVVDGAAMYTRADYSPYDGLQVTGWPRFTVSGGEVVVEDGEVCVEPGRGRLLLRNRHRGI